MPPHAVRGPVDLAKDPTGKFAYGRLVPLAGDGIQGRGYGDGDVHSFCGKTTAGARDKRYAGHGLLFREDVAPYAAGAVAISRAACHHATNRPRHAATTVQLLIEGTVSNVTHIAALNAVGQAIGQVLGEALAGPAPLLAQTPGQPCNLRCDAHVANMSFNNYMTYSFSCVALGSGAGARVAGCPGHTFAHLVARPEVAGFVPGGMPALAFALDFITKRLYARKVSARLPVDTRFRCAAVLSLTAAVWVRCHLLRLILCVLRVGATGSGPTTRTTAARPPPRCTSASGRRTWRRPGPTTSPPPPRPWRRSTPPRRRWAWARRSSQTLPGRRRQSRRRRRTFRKWARLGRTALRLATPAAGARRSSGKPHHDSSGVAFYLGRPAGRCDMLTV